MIYFTGDVHGEQTIFIKPPYSPYTYLYEKYDNFDDWHIEPAFSHLKAEDILIVCGDFGYLWEGSDKENTYLDALSRKLPFTLCFTDGNHENFPLIESYPITNWNGGRIHYIRDHIFHLMRGEIFEIDGVRLFAFGGAASTDSMHRIPGVSWWPQEVPNKEEIEYSRQKLMKYDQQVDIIVTHTAPCDIAKRYRRSNYKETYSDRGFTDYLAEIATSVNYCAWVHGHFHTNDKLGRFHCLYDKVVSADDLFR